MTSDYTSRPPRVLASEQRKMRDAQRAAVAADGWREHEAAQRAFHENRERLKAARLAREAK